MGFARFRPPSGRHHSRDLKPKPQVLYVEDEDINWEIAEHELAGEYDLQRALTAREAFKLIARHHYDVILLDIQLCGSEIDGIQVARLLKGRATEKSPDYAIGIHAEKTPILFVTGYTALYPKQVLLAAGGEDMLAKPIDFTRLSQVMARIMSHGVGRKK